jgi:hypothetical protein
MSLLPEIQTLLLVLAMSRKALYLLFEIDLIKAN